MTRNCKGLLLFLETGELNLGTFVLGFIANRSRACACAVLAVTLGAYLVMRLDAMIQQELEFDELVPWLPLPKVLVAGSSSIRSSLTRLPEVLAQCHMA